MAKKKRMQDEWLLTWKSNVATTLHSKKITQLSTDPSKVTMAELFHQIHEAVNDKLR